MYLKCLFCPKFQPGTIPNFLYILIFNTMAAKTTYACELTKPCCRAPDPTPSHNSKDALVTHVQPSQPRLSMKRLSELHTAVDSERSGTAQKEQTGNDRPVLVESEFITPKYLN